VKEARPRGLSVVAAVVIAVATLYLGKALFIPLALALLLSFLLGPLVTRLERLGMGRISSVLAVCLCIGALLGGIGWVVGLELGTLSDREPEYRAHLERKIEAVRESMSPIHHASEVVSDLEHQIQEKSSEASSQKTRPPAKVEVVERRTVLDLLSGLVAPVLGPLGVAGVVGVMTIFILLQREDLRDRLIRLIGSHDLTRVTHAMNEAGQRVSRYLGMQSLVCAIHGTMVTLGLLLIGVPGAPLWGALSALLRFVPYFGPWVAATLPIVLTFAAFDTWMPVVLTSGLLVILELVTANVFEPWLYGASVGLSPFAVVFSAVFWIWLWGLPGLLLAMPLTVCLVVLGRYVPELEFLPILLGDEPPLDPDVHLYQRLLALDKAEGAAILRTESNDCVALSDQLVLPVLRRLADEGRRALGEEATSKIRELLSELLDGLSIEGSTTLGEAAEARGLRVFWVPAKDETDALAARWLARTLEGCGVHSTVGSLHALATENVEHVEAEAPDVVCVSAFSADSKALARHLCKRLAIGCRGREILIGLWAAPAGEEEPPAEDGARITWITQARELRTELGGLAARLGVPPSNVGTLLPNADTRPPAVQASRG